MARCLALLGMVTTHVLDERVPSGGLTLGQAVAGGRASALFAVLAGVSLALMTGRREPLHGRPRMAAAVGLAVRALLIAAIGMALAEVDSGLAIILTYYGLLFLLGIPFIGLRARTLFVLAGVWVVAGPVLSHAVRPQLPPRGFDSPAFVQLANPEQLLSELAFTGYYPVVPWLAYLLAGMALGRLDLHDRRVQIAVASAGAALAVTATLVSQALTRRPDVVRALLAEPPDPASSGPELLDAISSGMHGTTPTDAAWQWLLVVAPHSGTPFDLAQTIGSALLVIGLALLVVGLLPAAGRTFVAVFFGAGTMTLTLYSLHVVMRGGDVWPAETPASYPWHLLVLMGIGALYVGSAQRGPLEGLVGATSTLAASRLRKD